MTEQANSKNKRSERRDNLRLNRWWIIAIIMLVGALFGFLDHQGNTAMDQAVPEGVIAMWSGNIEKIPSGWSLCDGSKGTPDLSDRFIMGTVSTVSDREKIGGGEVTLQPEHMPIHDHTINHDHKIELTIDPREHGHDYNRTRTDIVGTQYEGNTLEKDRDRGLYTGDSVRTGNQELNVSGTISMYEGSSGNLEGKRHVPIKIIPPFYKLAFIMKT